MTEMLSLPEYDLIAKKIIRVHAPGFKNDLEIIEAVTSAIMSADWQYDPTDHTGQNKKTIEGYRKQRARWAICETLKKKKRREKNSLASIDDVRELDYIEMPTYESDINFDFDFLNPAEQCVLNLRFNKNLNFREIGRKLKCTRQNAHQKFQSGLKKLRKNAKTLSILSST
jgi:hypothetical protein